MFLHKWVFKPEHCWLCTLYYCLKNLVIIIIMWLCVVLQPVYNSPDLVSPGNLRYLSLDILWTWPDLCLMLTQSKGSGVFFLFWFILKIDTLHSSKQLKILRLKCFKYSYLVHCLYSSLTVYFVGILHVIFVCSKLELAYLECLWGSFFFCSIFLIFGALWYIHEAFCVFMSVIHVFRVDWKN